MSISRAKGLSVSIRRFNTGKKLDGSEPDIMYLQEVCSVRMRIAFGHIYGFPLQ